MTKRAMVSHKQQQQEKVFFSGEVRQHCTNIKGNIASLPGNPQAICFVKLTEFWSLQAHTQWW